MVDAVVATAGEIDADSAFSPIFLPDIAYIVAALVALVAVSIVVHVLPEVIFVVVLVVVFVVTLFVVVLSVFVLVEDVVASIVLLPLPEVFFVVVLAVAVEGVVPFDVAFRFLSATQIRVLHDIEAVPELFVLAVAEKCEALVADRLFPDSRT